MPTTNSIKRRRPSVSTILSLIALFVALGGTSYAAISLPKNSVGAPQLKRGAVKSAKLANNAVTSAKVKDGSLLAKDFKAGQLPAGPQGPQGPQGPKGEPGISGYEIVTSSAASVPSGESFIRTVSCPEGKMAVGGGYVTAASERVFLNRSGPDEGGRAWTVRVTNESAESQNVRVQAICVNVAP